MADRARKGQIALIGAVWLALAALALLYLRVMGYRPRTVPAWLLVAVIGPAIMTLPYALVEDLMRRWGLRLGEPWSGRLLDARRVLLNVVALVLTLLALMALSWFATGPLATALRPLGPLANRHFEAVR